MENLQHSFAQKLISDPFVANLIRIRACKLCRRGDFSSSDFDDLRQGMRLHLIEKAHLFDQARGSLEAFVTRILSTWVAGQLRFRNRHKRRASYKAVSLERTAVEYEGHLCPLGSVLLEEDGHRLHGTDRMPELDLFELREGVRHVMASLDPEDQQLLTEVAEHGVAEVARTRQVSRHQITKTLARLRKAFEAAGFGSNSSASPRSTA